MEISLVVAGWILTAGLAGIGGTFAIQGRNSKRIETLREQSEAKIEKVLNINNQKIESLVSSSKELNESVLLHIKNVEKALNDMRAELPEKYTLKADHLRLQDKVEELTIQVFRFSQHHD